MTEKLTNIKKGLELSRWASNCERILLILDGCNIVHKKKEIIDPQRLNVITDYLQTIPNAEIVIFMTPSKKKKLEDLNQFESIKRKDLLYITPASQHDDWLMIELAKKKNGIILSNDKFQEYKPYYEEIIPSRVLTYLIIELKSSEKVVLIPELDILKKELNKRSCKRERAI